MSYTQTMRDDWNTGPAVVRPATPLRTAVELAVEESADARHQRRQRIRDKLAAEELANFRYQQAISDCDCFEEKAAGMLDVYRERRAPLEAELAGIERQQTQDVADRKPTDESLVARRGEVISKLQDLKAKRDQQSASYQTERERLDRVQVAAALKVPTGKRVTEKDLFDDGDKTLLAIHALAKHDSDAAITRFDLLQSPHLSTSREELDAQLALIEELTVARRAAYEAVVAE